MPSKRKRRIKKKSKGGRWVCVHVSSECLLDLPAGCRTFLPSSISRKRRRFRFVPWHPAGCLKKKKKKPCRQPAWVLHPVFSCVAPGKIHRTLGNKNIYLAQKKTKNKTDLHMKVGVVLVGGKLACFHSSAWLAGAIEAGRDWQRGNGNIKRHKPCELNNKNVQRDSYCVPFHRLPQPAGLLPLCIPLQPSSLPVLHRLVCTSKLNSLGRLGPDGPDSLWSCRGHVASSSKKCLVSVSLSVPVRVVYNMQQSLSSCTQPDTYDHLFTRWSRPLRRILYFFFYTTACPSGSRWCVPQWCSFTLFKHKVGNLKTTLFVLRHWGSRLPIEVYIRSVGGHLWFNHIYSFDWVLYYFCQSRKSTVLEDGRHQNKETKRVWFLRSICCSHGDCWE